MINLQMSCKIITCISIYKCSKEESNNLQCHGFAVINKLFFFYYDEVIFFLFLPKWGPFKKNYKFRQVMPNWDDFICRNRTN